MIRLSTFSRSTFIVLSFLTSISHYSLAATTLNVGEIMILYVNTDGTDEFGFVPLVDLEFDTKVYFTDKGVLHDTNTFRSGEGFITYTVPVGGITAGTVLQYPSSTGFLKTGSFNLAASGDQLFAFQDSDPNNAILPENEPTFLFGINLATQEIGDDCTASSANTSGVPTGLSPVTFGSDFGSYLALGSGIACDNEEDRVVYNSKLNFNNPTEVLEFIGDPDNWTTDSEIISTDYTCSENLIKATNNIFDIPIIELFGNGQLIPNEDVAPSILDDTDFENHSIYNTLVSKTFTIKNTGQGTLTLGADAVSICTNAGDFSVKIQPDKGIASNQSTTFTIEFDPSRSGLRIDTIKIKNSDSTKDPFRFVVQGTGICTPPSITSQPLDVTACIQSSTSFTVKATTTNGGILLYQWEHSTDGGITFNTLSDNGIYTNTDNKKLKLSGVTLSNNTEKFRVLVKERVSKDTCVSISEIVMLTVPNISLTGDLTQPSCNENNDGGIDITTSGGSSPYSYEWSTGSIVGDLPKGLTAGTYTITTTDNNGCIGTNIFTLSNPNEVCEFSKNPCGDLFFSKYIEGSGFNKAIEIFNPAQKPIDLDEYTIELFRNGSSSPTLTFSFPENKKLARSTTYLLTNQNSDLADLLNQADTLISGNALSFNGDDALLLLKGSDTIDIIGVIGVDPGSKWSVIGTNSVVGSTMDFTLVRNSAILQGQPNWQVGAYQEWLVFPQNTTDNLGSHITENCLGNSIITDFSDNVICKLGDVPITVGYNSIGIYDNTNIFTAQLSDANGSFSSPTNIGSITSNSNTGVISAIIPDATDFGNHYRLRVVASQPATIGCDNTTDIIITPTPVITGRDTSICGAQTIDLAHFIKETNIGNLSYGTDLKNWKQSSIVSPSITTVYYVRDSVKQTGCVDTTKIRITVNSIPMVSLQDTIACIDSLTEIKGNPSGGSEIYANHIWTIKEDGGTQITVDKLLNNNTPTISLDGSDLYKGAMQLQYQVIDNLGCTDSATINVEVIKKQGCEELYFSEYVEGSRFNKAIEVYNPSLKSIDLSEYTIHVFNNGSTSATSTFSFGNNQLAACKTYVIAHSNHDLTKITAVADTLIGAGSVVNFNGDDALILVKGTDTLDAIGIIGEDPGTRWAVNGLNAVNGFTRNFTLIRNKSVTIGEPNWYASTSTEWDVFSQDDLDNLGTHTQITCSEYKIVTIFDSSALCQSDETPINVDYNSSGIYATSNVFTLQLSDQNGSFDAATNLDSLNSSGNKGSITAYIPSTISMGLGYRLRVVSSNPAIVGIENDSDFIITTAPSITCRDTVISSSESINLSSLIVGTPSGNLSFATHYGDWASESTFSPDTTTIYYVRDSLLTTGCIDTASIRVSVNIEKPEPVFTFGDGDRDGKPDFGDPCSCSDPLNVITGNPFLFHDVFTITSSAGENWTLILNDGQFLQRNGMPFPIGTIIPPSSVNSTTYQLDFYHRSEKEANFSVSRNTSIDNFPQRSSICNQENCLPNTIIPTLSEWGLLILGLLILNMGLYFMLQLHELENFKP